MCANLPNMPDASDLNTDPAYPRDRVLQLSVNLSRYVGATTLQHTLGSASTLLPFWCRVSETRTHVKKLSKILPHPLGRWGGQENDV